MSCPACPTRANQDRLYSVGFRGVRRAGWPAARPCLCSVTWCPFCGCRTGTQCPILHATLDQCGLGVIYPNGPGVTRRDAPVCGCHLRPQADLTAKAVEFERSMLFKVGLGGVDSERVRASPDLQVCPSGAAPERVGRAGSGLCRSVSVHLVLCCAAPVGGQGRERAV
jgi:hypothetical protein